MSAAMTAQFVTDALVTAIWRHGEPDAMVHHSDRGSQQRAVPAVDGRTGVVCSMSRSGTVSDKAKTYRSKDEAKADVFDYIERFFNARRRHSTIAYLSPMEFERRARLCRCHPNRGRPVRNA